MINNLLNFKEILEAIEKALGKKGYQVGELMEIDSGTYTNMKKGKNPSIGPFINLIRKTTVNPEFILTGKGDVLIDKKFVDEGSKKKYYEAIIKECNHLREDSWMLKGEIRRLEKDKAELEQKLKNIKKRPGNFLDFPESEEIG